MSSVFFAFFVPILFVFSAIPSMVQADNCHAFWCAQDSTEKPETLISKPRHENNQKVYLKAESIAFEGNQILVNIAQEWVPVRAVQCNEGGYFVDEKDLPMGYWTCGTCGTVNYPWHLSCQRCR